MRRPVWLALAVALAAAGLSSGCVTRRVMITSDPPGAIVYRDGQPIGPTPVEQPFVYYGTYRYRLVKDGFAPLDVEPELIQPWYQYPGIDFVFENLIPFTFRDTQQLHFQLSPLEAVRHDDVRAAAEALRGRGKTIGPAEGRPRRTRKENAPGTDNAPAWDDAIPTSNEPSLDAPAANATKPKPEREPAGSAGFQAAPRRDAVSPPSPVAPSR